VNLEKNFSGAGREEIFESIVLDILAEKPLLKLIGKEGAGKSFLCRLIENRLQNTYPVVLLENPGSAFEDLLWMVWGKLGGEQQHPPEQMEVLPELQRLLERTRDPGKRVVLIIDEAEKLFLASLERLVRHVNEGSGGLRLTLLLAGHPGLDENLKQIGALGSGVSFSSTYTLSDLSESATRQYLRFRVEAAGMSREHFAEVFTEEVVAKIFTAAKGNLKLINILAEEAQQNFCAEKSFMALLDRVEPGTSVEPAPRPSRMLLLSELLRSNPMLTGALAGSIVLVLGIGLFLNFMGTTPPGDKHLSPQVPPQFAIRPQPLRQHGQSDPQAIVQERLKAGGDWMTGLYQEKYTIQLMKLSSPMAESRLAETLAMEEYASILDQVYSLRRQNPPTLFVYYGVYDSLDAAREARNSMPVFLRKHQPYPLSISEAKEKVDNN